MSDAPALHRAAALASEAALACVTTPASALTQDPAAVPGQNPAAILTRFALEQVPVAPLACRIEVYRALAAVTGTAVERAGYLAEAAACAALLQQHAAHETRHQQLLLNLRHRAATPRAVAPTTSPRPTRKAVRSARRARAPYVASDSTAAAANPHAPQIPHGQAELK